MLVLGKWPLSALILMMFFLADDRTALANEEPSVTARFHLLSETQGLNSNELTDLLVTDRDIWIGSYGGVARFDGKNLVQYQQVWDKRESLYDNLITKLYMDRQGRLWACGLGAINLYQATTQRFRPYPFAQTSAPNAKEAICDGVFQDSQGRFWIGTNKGLFKFAPNTGQMQWQESTKDFYFKEIRQKDPQHLLLSSFRSGTGLYQYHINSGVLAKIPVKEQVIDDFSVETIMLQKDGSWLVGSAGDGIFELQEDKEGYYLSRAFTAHKQLYDAWITDIIQHGDDWWLATRNMGLFRVSTREATAIKIASEQFRSKAFPANFDIHIDKEDILWVASSEGLYYSELRTIQFNLNNLPGLSLLAGKPVSGFAQINDTLWISSLGGGLLRYEQGTPPELLNRDRDASLYSDTIRDISADDSGRLWLATEKGPLIYDSHKKSFSPLTDAGGNPIQRYSGSVMHDSRGRTWLGYQGEIGIYDQHGHEIAFFDRATGLANGPVYAFCEDPQGTVWVGAFASGLAYIKPDLRESGTLSPDDLEGPPYDRQIYDIHLADAPGQLWLATSRGLQLIDTKTKELQSDSAPFRRLTSIQPHPSGHLWLAGDHGLYHYEPVSQRVLQHYTADDGLQDGRFIRNAALLSKEGNLYFGGIGGISYFQPQRVSKNRFAPEAYIATRLAQAESSLGSDSASTFSSGEQFWSVPYDDNEVTFKLFSTSRTKSEQKRFRFQLIGHDHAMKTLAPGSDTIRYTNLAPGAYQVKVQASNNSQVWGEAKILQRFEVLKPVWMRWYAWLFYIALNILLVYLLVNWRSKIIRQQNKKLASLVREKTQELRQTLSYKEDLFANISHEIRTPLTLMLGTLSTQEAESQRLKKLKGFISRISWLLDDMQALSSKTPASDATTIEQYRAEEFVAFYISAYTGIASDQRLHLQCNEAAIVATQPDLLDKVITNLVNNAIKYSPVDSPIEVSAQTNNGNWCFTVTNHGKGIKPEQLKAVFDRYVQLGNSNQSYGLGLGLPLVKKLVESVNGRIQVVSEPEQQTQVTVTLPLVANGKVNNAKGIQDKDASLLCDYQDWIQNEINLKESLMAVDENIVAAEEQSVSNERSLVFCVDDNPDLLQQLKQQLSESYRIECYADPSVALQQAALHVPDLIISDLMMPQFSGFELIRRVRNETSTSHIPVILLTAKSDPQSQVDGLASLADDYIVKPYDPELLISKVNSLINIRQLLRARFTAVNAEQISDGIANIADIDLQSVLPQERIFMEKVIRFMQKNLDNPQLGSDELGQHLCLSTSQMRRKIKAISGYTPQEVLRILRLESAARKILEGQSLKSVAHEVGFSNQSHMGTSFKAYFGVTPHQYRQNRAATTA